MRLELSGSVMLWMALGAASCVVAGSCSSSAPVVAPDAGTVVVGTFPPAPDATSTSMPTAVTVDSSTTLVLPPVTTSPIVAAPCSQTDGVVTTPSGRHVLVRASGVAPGSPLVLVLHGYTGTPTGIERYAEFTAIANAASVVVAYPEGSPVVEFEGFGWDTGSDIFSTSGVDDGAALNEMLDAVIATGCVDPSRITLTGESNGAAMSLLAVCNARVRDRVASVVLVNAAVDDGVLARCAPTGRALPMSVIAGRLDRTARYDGGRGSLLAQEVWFRRAATLVNGCAEQPGTREPLLDQVERIVPSGCGACTQLLTIADGTHTWPGSSDGVADLRPGTFDLSARLLRLALSPEPGCLT